MDSTATNHQIPTWMFVDKQNELMKIYQDILDMAAKNKLFDLMDAIGRDIQRDIRDGFFRDREKTLS
ncbi:MAG: hypothetical protein WAV40_02035 [Microgenomates group bacterium]